MAEFKRSVFRVNSYDTAGNVVSAYVMAGNSAAASAFVGAAHTLNVVEIASGVEIAGVDTPHARIAAPPATITPLAPGWGFSREEVSAIKTVLGKSS